jgi:hypothetical protein
MKPDGEKSERKKVDIRTYGLIICSCVGSDQLRVGEAKVGHSARPCPVAVVRRDVTRKRRNRCLSTIPLELQPHVIEGEVRPSNVGFTDKIVTAFEADKH